MDCGEPFKSQHLRIDFSPVEGVDDTDYLLQKCTDFWKLVEGSKKLRHLKVMPEKNVPDPIESTSSTETLQDKSPTPRFDAIEILQKQGNLVEKCLMNCDRRYCEGGSGDYFTDSSSKAGLMTWTPDQSRRPKYPSRGQRDEVTKMCNELEQWDKLHPKCMDPPNHGPPYTYSVMQRN